MKQDWLLFIDNIFLSKRDPKSSLCWVINQLWVPKWVLYNLPKRGPKLRFRFLRMPGHDIWTFICNYRTIKRIGRQRHISSSRSSRFNVNHAPTSDCWWRTLWNCPKKRVKQTNDKELLKMILWRYPYKIAKSTIQWTFPVTIAEVSPSPGKDVGLA